MKISTGMMKSNAPLIILICLMIVWPLVPPGASNSEMLEKLS